MNTDDNQSNDALNEYAPGDIPAGTHIDSLGGNCPVQAFGNWGDDEIYFRARGDSWSLEAGAGRQARGIFPSAGWMPLDYAAEIVRVHLWSWSWAEQAAKGQDESEYSNANADLRQALRELDAPGVIHALSRGANPSGEGALDGPTPLIMALALWDTVGEAPKDEELIIKDRYGLEVPAGLTDVERITRRFECVKALLLAGADPNGPLNSAFAPIHWAAALPVGQMGATWGMLQTDPFTDVQASACARARAREAEAAKPGNTPLWALLGAGADPWMERRGRDALNTAVACEAGLMFIELAQHMGGDAPRRAALATMIRAADERARVKSILSLAGTRGAHAQEAIDFAGDSFHLAVAHCSTKVWPLVWLADCPSLVGGVGGEVADEIRRRALSAIEQRELSLVARCAASRATRPGL